MAIDINIPSQVKNYANLAAFPATGSLKTIFIAEDTNKTYRWTGSAYVEISASQAAAWGTITGTLSNQTDLQTALNAKVTSNTAITGATKTKVTYDSKGLVTAGADATTADIADSTNKRYVTDANLTVIGNTSGTNTGDQTLSGLGGVPTTRTLTINGTTQDLSADRTFTISTGITIGTTAITSGTVGRVLFEGTGNVVQESANLFWDNTNGRLGIGTSSPSRIVEIAGTAPVLKITGNSVTLSAIQFTNNGGDFYVGRDNSGGSSFGLNSPAYSGVINARGSYPLLLGAADKTAIYVFPTTTNVHIGAGTTIPTDAGYKLDVNGTARFSGQVNVTTNTTIGTDGTITNTYLRNAFSACFGAVAYAPASVVLECRSTTQGFLPPRMTTTQKNAIASPATGLMVYDTTLNLISVYNGTTWITL